MLRALERAGPVERTVFPVVPPRTEYRLTEAGRKLHEPVAPVANAPFLEAVHARRQG